MLHGSGGIGQVGVMELYRTLGRSGCAVVELLPDHDFRGLETD